MFSVLHVTVRSGWDDVVFGVERLCPIPVLSFSLVNHAMIRLHVHLILVLLRAGMAHPTTGGFSCFSYRKPVPRVTAVTPVFCYGMTGKTGGCFFGRFLHLATLVYQLQMIGVGMRS